MTTQLLSSGEFRKLRYDTIPVKSASTNVSFYTSNSKSDKFWLVKLLSQMSDMIYMRPLLFQFTFCSSTLLTGLWTKIILKSWAKWNGGRQGEKSIWIWGGGDLKAYLVLDTYLKTEMKHFG